MAAITEHPFALAEDLVGATQDTGPLLMTSGFVKRVAVRLSKLCNDLRLLASGPRCGMGEITLPALPAGSSIMPGKVNPVIPEAVNQVVFLIVGLDTTVTLAAEAGQLELNAFQPVIAHALLESIDYLEAGSRTLTVRCIAGIEANEEGLRRGLEEGAGVAAALTPLVGYDAAATLVKDALRSGVTVKDLSSAAAC